MTRNSPPSERGLSNVLGAVLLVGIVILLAVVVSVFALGIEMGQPADTPEFAIDTTWKTGGDGTFSDPGDGGPCAGDTYDDDDSVVVIVEATNAAVEDENLEMRIDGETATVGGCGAGTSGPRYKVYNDPDSVGAGVRFVIAESDGSNVIQSGNELHVVWQDPDSEKSYVVAKEVVPER
jgi:flagellin-like protein